MNDESNINSVAKNVENTRNDNPLATPPPEITKSNFLKIVLSFMELIISSRPTITWLLLRLWSMRMNFSRLLKHAGSSWNGSYQV